MKALSVRQPWASLIATGRKTIEVRTWQPSYRGDLLICSGVNPDRAGLAPPFDRVRMPLGVALCVVRLVDCRRPLSGPDANSDFAAAGGFQPLPFHWCWELTDVRPLAVPVPMKGQLLLFSVPEEVRAKVEPQIATPPRH